MRRWLATVWLFAWVAFLAACYRDYAANPTGDAFFVAFASVLVCGFPASAVMYPAYGMVGQELWHMAFVFGSGVLAGWFQWFVLLPTLLEFLRSREKPATPRRPAAASTPASRWR